MSNLGTTHRGSLNLFDILMICPLEICMLYKCEPQVQISMGICHGGRTCRFSHWHSVLVLKLALAQGASPSGGTNGRPSLSYTHGFLLFFFFFFSMETKYLTSTCVESNHRLLDNIFYLSNGNDILHLDIVIKKFNLPQTGEWSWQKLLHEWQTVEAVHRSWILFFRAGWRPDEVLYCWRLVNCHHAQAAFWAFNLVEKSCRNLEWSERHATPLPQELN